MSRPRHDVAGDDAIYDETSRSVHVCTRNIPNIQKSVFLYLHSCEYGNRHEFIFENYLKFKHKEIYQDFIKEFELKGRKKSSHIGIYKKMLKKR